MQEEGLPAAAASKDRVVLLRAGVLQGSSYIDIFNCFTIPLNTEVLGYHLAKTV